MIFSHKCNQMMKRIIGKKGKVVIDQLKFTCLDDEEEDENDEQLETWVCTDRSWEAIILIENDDILLDKNNPNYSHTCKPCIKMTQIEGLLDGYHFQMTSENVWKCVNCECVIRTHTDGFCLKHLHSDKMHQCN